MKGNTVPFNPVDLFRYLNPISIWKKLWNPQSEFLDVIWTKVLRVFLLAIHGFYSPPPPLLSKSVLKLACLKTQDYAQKPQRNCAFMNSASGDAPSITMRFPDLNEIQIFHIKT